MPLAAIQEAVLELLRGRRDAVIFGAQAVNAYVDEPRMTQAIDILSLRAADLARELRTHLARRFHIAVRVRESGEGGAYRLYQVQKPRTRHLVDIRQVGALPPTRKLKGLLVVAPPDLIATKVIAFHRRRRQPKSGSDWRDLAVLLLAFPELRADPGPVRERLQALAADGAILRTWEELLAQEIQPEDEEGEF